MNFISHFRTRFVIGLTITHVFPFFRLEDEAFTEPTQTYYTLEIKSIKFKRDSLVKVTHQVI